MGQSAWDRLTVALGKTFYFEILIAIASIFVLYLATNKFRNERLSHLFIVYSGSCILVIIIPLIQRVYFPLTGRPVTIFTESLNSLFAISELLVFIIFFFNILKSKSSKKLLGYLSTLFAVAIILYFAKALNTNSDRFEILRAAIVVNVIEFLILLIAILMYFIQIFTQPPILNLARSPSFWISSGLFIYILVSLPMLLFHEHVWEERYLYYLLYSFHFLSLTLLLLTIIKGFLCRQPITT